ncbi:hypothetical protein FACS189472_10000 [Alphaproteobacteria bacterium]|nr:hypothetical protein FACS189472_10000 [Alphaproteobacteria bacterium]
MEPGRDDTDEREEDEDKDEEGTPISEREKGKNPVGLCGADKSGGCTQGMGGQGKGKEQEAGAAQVEERLVEGE